MVVVVVVVVVDEDSPGVAVVGSLGVGFAEVVVEEDTLDCTWWEGLIWTCTWVMCGVIRLLFLVAG